jgi:hypothetical protein
MSSNSITVPEIQPLPQNQETEKTILASLIYDNALIPQAASLLTAEDFYSTDNQRLFQAVLSLHRQDLVVDICTLAAHGINSGYLAELSEHESTANLKHHVDSLKSAAFRRKAINAMAVASQKLCDPDASFTDAVNELTDAIKLPDVDFQERIYIPTFDNCPEQSQPLIELSNVKILTRGNISMFTACAGAGKSSVLEAACAAAIASFNDNLGLSLNVTTLLYIDSERSEYDHHQSWQRFLKRAGVDNPAGCRWENIRAIDNIQDRRAYLWSRLDCDNPPELVLIDGIGDFVLNPNDSEECVSLVSRLCSITHKKNIGVLVTLHNNPAMNSEKARGILGSELWRKSEAVLIIEKLADGTRKLTTDYSLGKNRSGSDTISSFFKWDDEKKMHVTCQPPAEAKGKTSCEREKILELLKTRPQWSYAELWPAISELTGRSERTSKSRITELLNLNKIVKNNDGTYSGADKNKSQSPDYYHE